MAPGCSLQETPSMGDPPVPPQVFDPLYLQLLHRQLAPRLSTSMTHGVFISKNMPQRTGSGSCKYHPTTWRQLHSEGTYWMTKIPAVLKCHPIPSKRGKVRVGGLDLPRGLHFFFRT